MTYMRPWIAWSNILLDNKVDLELITPAVEQLLKIDIVNGVDEFDFYPNDLDETIQDCETFIRNKIKW